MRTIILPGYSLHNKDWAYDVKSELESAGFETLVYEWKHWSGGKMNITSEVENIKNTIGDEEVNIIAKSVGTKVFMKLLSGIKSHLNKVILCGIPFDPVGYLSGINMLGAEKLIIIQNSQDPFMPYSVINKFVKIINKEIRVVRKEAENHDYPYYDEFINFLK
ncbi:MAG: hypothetical protein ACD_24C00043G0002 [uncultured bacterium]|nr:MAG: hypothetical protein ACD_24C00043G0002 [uncultured bacterium]